jgi:hypothetical protein
MSQERLRNAIPTTASFPPQMFTNTAAFSYCFIFSGFRGGIGALIRHGLLPIL